MKGFKKIYLDHNATTPVDTRVLKKMMPYFSEKFGNPSSSHACGKEAREAVEQARLKISKVLRCTPEELIFTNGGTEAENLAVKGLAFSLKKYGNHTITSVFEHHAVECSFDYLTKHGFVVSKVSTNKNGFINIEELENLITEKTILISIMAANNEIGSIQPIKEISGLIEEHNKKRKTKNLPPICFHTDSEAAFSYLECNPQKLGVSALTINGSKIHGPKGVGVLYVKKGCRLATQICGGGQERFLRGGTENVPAIIGLGEAAALIYKEREKNKKHVLKLRDFMVKRILAEIPDVKLNSPQNNCLPHVANFLFNGINAKDLVELLSQRGIAVSTGSACSSQDSQEISATLKAIGLSDAEAKSSIRFSLGKLNQKEDMKYLMKILPSVVSRLRKK
ncbi:MAG: cysteine desulfurase family protein [Patescibacteria group bacterium]